MALGSVTNPDAHSVRHDHERPQLPTSSTPAVLTPHGDVDLQEGAAQAWCAWEERLATLSGPTKRSARYTDRRFRLGFARLVTHFFGNHAFLPPEGISGRLANIGDVPAVFVRGRLDIASPLGVSWRLAQQLPRATLHVVEHEAHGGADITDDLFVQATNDFAA